ncbi:A/G-specific adenine glycosylase [Colletotrichum orchidophilum]|uniref:Adenine DNA glycosylase n=1 Tax=Colletotrichum orchidophilum TaxID=1209926 RepID=A0A1G4ARY7_9PEZI|nr:A/G-specific adenine glycosylase [Colletotrichum orchidophilum]OHE91875.1 A/G-specific adenine glycosylase [Colletotrichum orchidophilum]
MIQRRLVRRQSSLAAAKRILAQADSEPDVEIKKPASRPRLAATRNKSTPPSPSASKDASEEDFSPPIQDDNDDDVKDIAEPPPKRRRIEKNPKTRKADTARLHASLFGPPQQQQQQVTHDPCCSPAASRTHATSYHRPLLLDGQPGRRGRDALLGWFDSISTTRGMPWRKPWIDPKESWPDDDTAAANLRCALEKRAYEVWISEIMLQQTRVAVVIDYWNRWMARWPTIQDLAAAEPEDVLSAWRGLGYYSRATRIHEAAKLVVADPDWRGLMPSDTAELEAKVPGVGRYTAGAVAAIVFGEAAPMVDGNVLRVLSRQLGLYGNAKTDKAVIDLLWAAADALVKAVAKDGPGEDGTELPGKAPLSDRPGRWGQALMELGSTVCTPKPNCGECPVTSTCRAFAEGLQIAASKSKKTAQKIKDIEDLCSICEPFEEGNVEETALSGEDSDADAPKPAKGAKKGAKTRPGPKQATLSAFFTSKTAKKKDEEAEEPSLTAKPKVAHHDARTLEIVAEHARKFPLKVVKKAVREEEALVCAVRRGSDRRFLIHRRPEKGLLAGLWELPSHTLPPAGAATAGSGNSNTATSRKKDAQGYVSGLISGGGGDKKKLKLRYAGELGSVPWLFSHLKLTMHVYLFEVDGSEDLVSSHARHRWATAEEVDEESMGTGMRKCWALVRERNEESLSS